MKITMVSIAAAVLWSSAVVGILWLYRRKHCLKSSSGALVVAGIYALCVLRMLAPIDFSFTVGIEWWGYFSDILHFMTLEPVTVFGICVTRWDLVLLVLAAGAVGRMLAVLRQHIRFWKCLKMLPVYPAEQAARVASRVCAQLGVRMDCALRICPSLGSPMGYGIFHRYILLPDGGYSDEELFHILCHEYIHMSGWDLPLKLALEIFCCLFWWNPVLRFLQDDFSRLIEIRCDSEATRHMPKEEACGYMNTIMCVMEEALARQESVPLEVGKTGARIITEISRDAREPAMLERFRVLQDAYRPKRGRTMAPVVLILTAALFLGSYAYLPIPAYDTPIEEIEEDGAIYIDPERSWIYEEGGEYYLVINGGETDRLSPADAYDYMQDGFPLIEPEKQ